MIPEPLYLIPGGRTNTHTHTHTTHDALRRKDQLVLAGTIETPRFLPNHQDESISRRTYLRVPLAKVQSNGQLMQLKGWLVQLSHIKVGGKRGPSHLGTNPLNKKIRLLCAALNQGRDEAAAASTRGNPLIPVTLGDQNLTEKEVLTNRFFLSSYLHPINVAASNVVEADRHQDLIVVDADPGVTMEPIGCDVVGFDRAHKAVQARIAAVSASPEVAASAAAEVAAPAAAEVAALAAASAAAVQEEPSSESEALEAAIEGFMDEVDYGGTSDDMEVEPMPSLADVVLPTGADVVQELDRDAQAVAAQEDDEATVATIDEVDSDSSDTQEEPDEGQEDARVQESEVSEALVAVAASTREPLRRQVMKSRIVVTKEYGSEKYFMVLAASQSEAEIDRVIAARKRAILDEGNELFGTSTYDASARILLDDHRRAWLARSQEGHSYMVFGAALQKRSRFYAFSDWAATPDGSYYLHKEDKQGRWQSIPRTSDAGRFVIPRYAKRVFKTHCDHTFGGQVWFDVLNQVGGCPTEFVDAWNAVINQRLQVGF